MSALLVTVVRMIGNPNRQLVFEFTPDSMRLFEERVAETGFDAKSYLTMVIQSYMTPRQNLELEIDGLSVSQFQELIEVLIEACRSDLFIRSVVGLIIDSVTHKQN